MNDVYVSRVNSENSDELQHYGVKGMKWGVRRDVELLANSRRNKAVRKAKNDYERGKITKDQLKSAKKQAKSDKKDYMNKVKKEFESKSKAEQYKMSTNIKDQAISKVPNRRLKKGVKAVNAVFTAANIAQATVTSASLLVMAPAAAPIIGASLAGAAIGEVGRKYVVDKIVDRAS